jgi:hypothetical protein
MEKKVTTNKFTVQILKRKLLYLYGVFNNSDFWFYSPDIVNAITSSVQLTIKSILQNLQNEIKDFDFLQSASDSVIFSSQTNIEKIKTIIQDVIKIIEDNTGIQNKLKFTIDEYDFCVSLTTNKYCLVKGKEVVLKGFPKSVFLQNVIKKLILIIVYKNHDEILFNKQKNIFLEMFEKLPINEISHYHNVNSLSEENEIGKAVNNFNNIVIQKNINVPLLRIKDKVKIIYLKKEPFIIAFKNFIPKEIEFEIDFEKQKNKFFENCFESLEVFLSNVEYCEIS